VIAAVALLAGCGGERDEPVGGTVEATTAQTPTATATPTPTPTPAATATAAPTATATAPPEEEGGDESGNRVPVTITLAVEDVIPARIEVPAFLGLRMTVKNESGSERRLLIDGETVLEILPGATERIDVEGLRPGDHQLEAGESGRAVIVAGRAE
jgi:hypothetical protein